MNRSKARSSMVSAAFALLVGLSFSARPSGLKAAETGSHQGATLFKSKCVICHGADGSGNTPIGKAMKIVDLRSPEVQKQSDAQLAAVISRGKQKMPSFGTSLTKAQITELVTFIRTLARKR